MIKEFAKNWKMMIGYLIIPIVLIGIIVYSGSQNTKEKTQYYQVVSYFVDGQVSKFDLDLSSGKLEYILKDNAEQVKIYSVPNVDLFVNDVNDYIVKYNVEHPDAPIEYDYIKGVSSSIWLNMLPTILMMVLLLGGVFFITKKMSKTMEGETNRTLSFGKSKAKTFIDTDNKRNTFADVAGADEEKAELSEIVEFLKNPEKFNSLGARIPKGVLLVGPPGTGKTLLARAVAGEAGAPFLSISGSNFVEMYVGVGASRVRDLFEQAKKASPAIIFIDEIDAVGRKRGAGMGGGNDEREQTLNQLLIEMDGFEGNTGVIVIAATNRPDILDSALLRPGRFDRQITVGFPDTKGREDILKVHSRNKAIGPDVRLSDIAKATVGFTGADLENLLNEAALLAARRGHKAITKEEIDEATIKVVMGTEKKSHKISDKEKKLTAYHEAGHAIATYFVGGQNKVHQVSIIPRGGAGGYTMSLPGEDRIYQSRESMFESIIVLLGGRVCESILLGDISTGASNDLQRATKIATDMVTKYGMSDRLGPLTFGSDDDEVFIGRDYGRVRDYSEETAALIDEEIKNIITTCYKRTVDLINKNKDCLIVVAEELISREKIDGDEFDQLITNGFIAEKEEAVVDSGIIDEVTSAITDADDMAATDVDEKISEDVNGDAVVNNDVDNKASDVSITDSTIDGEIKNTEHSTESDSE